MKMRVLYVNTYYSPNIGGGAEVTLKTIVDGVRARGHDVAVACTNPTGGYVESVVDGVPVFRFSNHNLYSMYGGARPGIVKRMAWNVLDVHNPKTGREFGDVIDRWKPDVISAHNLSAISTSAWSAARTRGVPVVQVLHDLYLACPATTMMKKGAACSGQCMRCRAFRIAHPARSQGLSAVVGVSRFIVDRLTSLGYFKGVDQYVINNARPLQNAALSVPTTVRTFGYIGSLIPSKGVQVLIEAFRKAFSNLETPPQLLIAGRGADAYVDTLKEAAGHGKDIVFLGHVSAAEFFSRVDVPIIPSIWPDTFPGVAVEAAAYGRAPIASNIGGIPEIVSDGINGRLFEPGDVTALAALMRSAFENPETYAALCQAAPQAVSRLLDTDRMISEYEHVLSQVRLRSGDRAGILREVR